MNEQNKKLIFYAAMGLFFGPFILVTVVVLYMNTFGLWIDFLMGLF